MKALTVLQPWASLIAIGAKRFETRSWETWYRGPLAIHASKKDGASLLSHEELNAMLEALKGSRYEVAHDWFGEGFDYDFPYGAVVATADLVDCLKVENVWVSPGGGAQSFMDVFAGSGDKRVSIRGDELLFGDFSHGRIAWVLENVKMLDVPAPARGRQGLWNWEGVK